MTGKPVALRTAFTRADRSWCRSRSQLDDFKWRMAAVAAAQIAGGRAVVKMNPGAYERTASTNSSLAAM
jgi:hypothetical protein